jgi:hypothetical protein
MQYGKMKPMGKWEVFMLHFRTSFNEYSGKRPEDVIQAVYADGVKADTGMSFDEWWQYQRDAWGLRYGLKIPAKDEPGAAKELLGILVEIGALETVKKPKPKKSAFIRGT